MCFISYGGDRKLNRHALSFYVPFGLIEETEETIAMTFIHDTDGLVSALIFHKLIDLVACLFYKIFVDLKK